MKKRLMSILLAGALLLGLLPATVLADGEPFPKLEATSCSGGALTLTIQAASGQGHNTTVGSNAVGIFVVNDDTWINLGEDLGTVQSLVEEVSTNALSAIMVNNDWVGQAQVLEVGDFNEHTIQFTGLSASTKYHVITFPEQSKTDPDKYQRISFELDADGDLMEPASTATISDLQIKGAAAAAGPYNATNLTVTATVADGENTASGARYSLKRVKDNKYYTGSGWDSEETWNTAAGTATAPSVDLSTILAGSAADGSYTITMYGTETGFPGKGVSTESVTQTFSLDNTAPEISSIARKTPAATYTNAATVQFTVTYNEAVTGVSTDDFTATNGTVSNVSGGGATWTVTVTTSADGSMALTEKEQATGAKDLAGNLLANKNKSISYVIDKTAPTIGAITTAGNAIEGRTDVALSGTITVAVTEANGIVVDKTKITFVSTNASNQGTVSNASYNAGTLTITYSGLLYNTNDYKLNIAAGALKDEAGNANLAKETAAFTTINGTPNTATFGENPGNVEYGDTFTLTVTHGNNDSIITWPDGGTYFEAVGAARLEGNVHSKQYKVIAVPADAQTLHVIQVQKDVPGGAPILGFTHDFTITPKKRVIDLGAGTVTPREYNASNEVAVTTSITNLVGQDEVTLPAIKGTMADANVGTGKPVTVSAVDALALSGAAAGKYTLVGTVEPTNVTANITAKAIDVSTATISGVTATKEYDGAMTNAAVTTTGATIETGVNSEKLTLTGPASVTYTDDDDVSTDHTYSIAAADFGIQDKDSALASNYALTGTKEFGNGVITKKTIAIAPTNENSNAAPYTVVQDQPAVAISSLTGAWTAPGAPTTLTLGTDFTVTYSLTDGKSVASLSESDTKIAATGEAEGITVTAAIALTGPEAGNYTLSGASKVLYFKAIDGVQIPFTVPDAQTKTYGDGTFSVAATIGTGDPAHSSAAAALDQYNYESNATDVATVDAQGQVTIVGAGSATITITAKAKSPQVMAYDAVPYVDNSKTVAITVNKADLADALKTLSFTKEYDGNANLTGAAPTNATITGANDETFTVSAVNGAYQAEAGVNTAKVADATKVKITGLTLTNGTGDADNYNIGETIFTSGAGVTGLNITTTAPSTISKKAIALSTSLTKAYDGNADPTGALDEVGTKTFSADPVISGDTITITGVSGAYTSKDVHAAAASAVTFTVTGAENYNITWTVTDAVTVKIGATVAAETEDISIQTSDLTSADSYLNATGLVGTETPASIYGALNWDNASSAYKSGSNMSVAFYKLKESVTPNGGEAGTWADFNKAAETPAAAMGDVLELIDGTAAEPAAGTYYVLINATEAATDVGNYNVTGFAAKDTTLLANFTKLTVSNPPSGGGGGVAVPPAAEGGVKVSAQIAGGEAKLTITTAELNKAEGDVQIDLSSQKKEVNSVVIPAVAVAKLAEKIDNLELILTKASVILDDQVLKNVAKEGGNATVIIEEQPKTVLPTHAQNLIAGETPVFKLTFKAGSKDLHELGGKATVKLPYVLGAGQDARFLVVWRMVDGKPQPIDCNYHRNDNLAEFVTDRFSLYTVAYFPFDDVAADSWYYSAAASAYASGLMNGMGDYKFQPNFKVSRAMLVTMLYSLENKPAVSVSNPFSDIASGAWYANPVLWAFTNGIVSGRDDGTFDANTSTTREQMALMLYNYAKQKGYDVTGRADLSSFKDAGKISGWAQEALCWANANGLINGRDDGTLDPKGAASRAEVAAVMQSFAAKFAQ